MALSSGTRLGPYEILALIGAGGMGEVYKARDTRLDRVVAIKVSDQRFSERFEREARAVAALNHPHICQLYDVGPNYLVMEHIEGKPLQGPLPVDKAVRYAAQILDALDAAHRKGITHRDLKPANILLSTNGVKLLDFGLAKMAQSQMAASEAVTMNVTQAHTLIGTLQYMSPEQLQAKEADARSDIFAFGLVWYELLTGRRAFEGADQASLIASVLKDDPTPPSAIVSGAVPMSVDHLVRTCLAKDPDDRWQTARDLKRELLRIIDDKVIAGPLATPGGKSRERIWISVAAASVVALLVLLTVYVRQSPPNALPLRVSVLPPEGATFVNDANFGGSALSPDGRMIVFGGDINGKRSLYVRNLDSMEARLIPNTEGAGKPFWSPNSRAIGFFIARSKGGVFRADLAGGEPVRLGDAGPRGGDWNRDGLILFTNSVSSGKPGGLYRVAAAGGAPERVTTLDSSAGENAHYWPQFLPDGKHFLFLVRGAQPEKNAIYIGSLDDAPAQSKRVRVIASSYRAVYAPSPVDRTGYLIVHDGGTLFAQHFDPERFRLEGERIPIAQNVIAVDTNGFVDVSVSPDGKLVYGSGVRPKLKPVWRDRDGAAHDATAVSAQYNTLQLSPDGHKAIAAVFGLGVSDITILDLVRGTSTSVVRDQTANHSGIWSADGSEIAYDTPEGLFRAFANGAGSPEKILDIAVTATSWSHDGRYLMYESGSDGKKPASLWILPLTGDRKPFPYLQGNADLRSGVFSPDGRFVAYTSNESGREEVYVQTNPAGKGTWQISIQGGTHPKWREDGKELFFMSSQTGVSTRTLMAASVTLNGGVFTPGAIQPLFDWTAPLNTTFGVFDIGRRFLVVEPAKESNSSLTLVVNWLNSLK